MYGHRSSLNQHELISKGNRNVQVKYSSNIIRQTIEFVEKFQLTYNVK